MKPLTRFATVAILVCVGLLSVGCASTGTSPDGVAAENDPLQNINRAILDFNIESDRYLLKPIARWYQRYIPSPVRNGARNFFSNLWEINNIFNDVLQGKFLMAGRDGGRLLINTILGAGGLNDVATPLGIPGRNEDFGQTLAVWGVPSGPYLVLPFLGPSNLRDAFGLLPQWYYTDVFAYVDSPEVWYLAALRLIDARSRLLGADEILELQADQYLFLRDAYRQRRLQQIHDGNPPAGDGPSEEDLLEELLDEDF